MPVSTRTARPETMADLLKQLGGISPRRVRMQPPPGRATEKDVIRILDRTNRICELVDGVLVEKVMGYPESALACDIIRILGSFLDEHDLGDLSGADGTVRLMPKLIRIPDVAFVRWEKLPNRERPTKPIPELIPDLAIEVLSEGNTRGEMKRKLRDYFLAGVSAVWFVDMRRRTVEVFTAPDQSTVLTEKDTLDGGDVLPGLRLPVKKIFAKAPRADRKKNKRTNQRKK